MNDVQLRMILLWTDDLDRSIEFYTETLGFELKFRDGDHYAAIDGGTVTLALATTTDHPLPRQVVLGLKTDDVDAAAALAENAGGTLVTAPYVDGHERRAVIVDDQGNGIVFYG